MSYAPAIHSAKAINEFEIGKHTAVLFDEIVPLGPVEYRFILAVFDEQKEPCYYVGSEVNKMAEQFGGGSHFLGLFTEEGHVNCGDSDDWADEAKFTAEALRIVREKFDQSSD